MLGSSDWIFWRPLFKILSRRLPQALGDALAQNNSVTSLDLAETGLGDEGAKARQGRGKGKVRMEGCKSRAMSCRSFCRMCKLGNPAPPNLASARGLQEYVFGHNKVKVNRKRTQYL